MPSKAELEAEVDALRAKVDEFQSKQESSTFYEATDSQGSGDLRELIKIMQEQQMVFQQTLTGVLGRVQNRSDRVPARKMDVPQLKAPAEVTLAEFREWEIRFAGYAKGTRLSDDYDMSTQREVLRGALHMDWGKLWSGKTLDITDNDNLDQIIAKLKGFLRKSRNPILDRVNFHKRDQKDGEPLNMYVSSLRSIMESCEFPEPKDCANCKNMVECYLRDRFICGLINAETQRKVLEVPFAELTLDKALSVSLAHESSKKTQECLKEDVVCTLRKSTYKKEKLQQRVNVADQKSKAESVVNDGAKPRHEPHCSNCGGLVHSRDQCPAKGKTCKSCQRKGHYARVCRAAPQSKVRHESMRALILGTMQDAEPLDRVAVDLRIAGHTREILWIPDTAATCNAIPKRELFSFPEEARRRIPAHQRILTTADRKQIRAAGVFHTVLRRGAYSYKATVYVLEDMPAPLLPKKACVALGLLPEGWPTVGNLSVAHPEGPRKIVHIEPANNTQSSAGLAQQLQQQFPAVFDSSETLGAMKGPRMHIEVTEDAVPVRHYKVRTIPFHWQQKVKEQLDDMVAKDVVEKVPVGHSPMWIHPMMALPKKNSAEPRMVVDLTGLNRYVKRPVHPAGVPRELVAQIPPGQQWFTTLDARHGYWQIELDNESRDMTTFLTPWGLYRYKRNVMGLASAGDEFTRRVDQALDGLSNIKRVVEDIIIYDSSYQDHVRHVQEVIKRCECFGITLHTKKCVFAANAVNWCGFHISSDGYTIDKDLCSAILNFPRPKSLTDVRSFCGLVNQFESFSPEIAKRAQPLRALLSPSSKFSWNAVHEEAFQGLTNMLSGPRVLAPFCPGADLRMETDASRTGLGFALWQRQRDQSWRLLRCGSRFVTETESRYGVSELELLAVVWAFQKSEMFVKGTTVELIVDHKPLVPIVNSMTLDQIGSTRLARLRHKLRNYQVRASWRKGTMHTVVDVFSRYPVTRPEDSNAYCDSTQDAGLLLASIFSKDDRACCLLTDPTIVAMRQAGDQDDVYIALKHQIQRGFPQKKGQLPMNLQGYWAVRDRLKVEDGLVLFDDRLVIPQAMRAQVLKDLHASHSGIERTLQRARQCVYWTGITEDIRQTVRACRACNEFLPNQQKEPIFNQPIPSACGESVAADIFSLAGKHFLVVTDRCSGWPEVWCVGSAPDTATVIERMTSWVSRYGVPVSLTTDGGPQFKSLEFREWCNRWSISHEMSSPYHPIANGHAEAAVKAMKFLAKKCAWNGSRVPEAMYKGLLEWRCTPRSDGISPAERLYGHSLRTMVPSIRQKAANLSQCDVRARAKRVKSNYWYNRGAKALPQLERGNRVLLQHPITKKWDERGEVLNKASTGRSYTVQSDTGQTYWRNRRFLRPERAAPKCTMPFNDAMAPPAAPLRRSARIRKMARS